MRQVISAPQNLDVSALAARLAQGRPVLADPSRALCERYGYQTLYEVPTSLQKQLRRELIVSHAARLRESGNVVCDHSVFAWLSDWMRWLWGETPPEEWESVLADAAPAVEHSEVIFHVTAGPEAAYDAYRWRDARNARQVERVMRQLYRDFGVEARVRETEA